MVKEFVYSDLFKLLPQAFKVSKLEFTSNDRTPTYSSDTSNNGRLGFVDREPLFSITEKTPVYLVFGDHTKTMNIVHESFCVMDNVKVLLPKFDMSDEVLLYITTAWKKAIPNLGYARHWSVAKIARFELPVIESPDPSHTYTVDDIDWQYMRDYITEIERDYITEIDTYLKVTGLDDYELTDEDKKTLADAKTHALGNFKVKDILPPIKVKKYASKPMTEGNVPFVSCQSTNNGIAVYCDETPEIRHCITVSTNGNCFDCFWHDYPIIPSSDVEVLSKDGITDDREISLYLCGALAPNTKLYSYSNKPKNGKVFDTIVSLPVVKSPDPSHAYTVDDIDWDFMKRYTRAIEKQTIADVVRFRNRELAATRQVIGVA